MPSAALPAPRTAELYRAEGLPEELQQAVKTELASRYFGGLDGEAPPLDIDPWLDLIRRLRRTGESATDE